MVIHRATILDIVQNSSCLYDAYETLFKRFGTNLSKEQKKAIDEVVDVVYG